MRYFILVGIAVARGVRMRTKKTEPVPDRRQVLRLLSNGLVLGLGVPLGCSSSSEADGTRVPIAIVPVGGRVRVLDGENPVELQRTAAGTVSARSLWCTHFGCEVAWSEDRGAYLCPCHDGVFDPEGRPLSGPPVRSLASVPVTVQGAEILLGAAMPGGAD